jgi:hypothetical protein
MHKTNTPAVLYMYKTQTLAMKDKHKLPFVELKCLGKYLDLKQNGVSNLEHYRLRNFVVYIDYLVLLGL